MADWSLLPTDLLTLIAGRLHTHSDLLRFRSVCSTWRNLPLSPPHPTLSSPILPVTGVSTASWGFYLSKRTVFSLSSPHFPARSWLVKVEQDNSMLTHIVNPLSRTRVDPELFPREFPKVLDLMGVRVSEVGFEYILQNISYRPFATSIGDAGSLYMEKVSVCFDSQFGFLILTIHVSGRLAIIRIGDKEWTVISDLVSPYDDVALFEGRFYAVDNTGRAVVVNLGSSSEFSPFVELVADPVFGGDKKTMVASCGELLLVDMYLSVGPEDDMGFEGVDFYEEFDCYMSERTVRFKVFRLDWGQKKWDEVKDLGDRMLFLGYYCAFSAPASDFEGCKGNCIIFADHNFYSTREDECWEWNEAVKGRGVGVFDLESGSIGCLGNCPDYFKMFWPPPSWILSTMLEDDLNQLRI